MPKIRQPRLEYYNVRMNDKRVVQVPRWLVDGLGAATLERVQDPNSIKIRKRAAKHLSAELPEVQPVNRVFPLLIKAPTAKLEAAIEEAGVISNSREMKQLMTPDERLNREWKYFKLGPVWSKSVIDGKARNEPKLRHHADVLGVDHEQLSFGELLEVMGAELEGAIK